MQDPDLIFPTSYIGQSQDPIVDVAYDLGRRHLATISEARQISIFRQPCRQDGWAKWLSVNSNSKSALNKVCWSHPVYGLLLAVGSSNGNISFWLPEPDQDSTDKMADKDGSRLRFQGSVSTSAPIVALEFAPRQHGLRIAAASTTEVSIFSPSPRGDKSWQLENIIDSSQGNYFTSLAWQPSRNNPSPMLVVGSTHAAKLWMYQPSTMGWQQVSTLVQGGINAVAWANSSNRPNELIALSSGQLVRIFGMTGRADKPQTEELAQLSHPAKVTQLVWHPLASWLAALLANSEVHLWRPNLAGEWKLIQRLVGTPEDQMDTK